MGRGWREGNRWWTFLLSDDILSWFDYLVSSQILLLSETVSVMLCLCSLQGRTLPVWLQIAQRIIMPLVLLTCAEGTSDGYALHDSVRVRLSSSF